MFSVHKWQTRCQVHWRYGSHMPECLTCNHTQPPSMLGPLGGFSTADSSGCSAFRAVDNGDGAASSPSWTAPAAAGLRAGLLGKAVTSSLHLTLFNEHLLYARPRSKWYLPAFSVFYTRGFGSFLSLEGGVFSPRCEARGASVLITKHMSAINVIYETTKHP